MPTPNRNTCASLYGKKSKTHWTNCPKNKSYEDIAAASGVPLKTLLSRKHYAVVFLRKRLKKIYEMILYAD